MRLEAASSALSGEADWAVVVLDLRSGRERELVSGLRSNNGVPPFIRWSADGTRLLVWWPGPSGI